MPKTMKQEEVTTDTLLADLQAVVADAEALLKATAGLAPRSRLPRPASA